MLFGIVGVVLGIAYAYVDNKFIKKIGDELIAFIIPGILFLGLGIAIVLKLLV